ncbi:MAG: KilA-N domain-containing protein [Nanoarchaeota archaeon]
MKKKEIVNVEGIDIDVINVNSIKYISLTDIARKKNPEEPRFVVINWLRNRNTVEFLCIWEKIHNQNFNRVGFDTVRA